MNKNLKYLIGCCLCLALVAGCSSEDPILDFEVPTEDTNVTEPTTEEQDPEPEPEPEPEPPLEDVKYNLSSAELRVARQTAGFATDFFKAVNNAQDNQSENLVVSPLSAQILLSMLANAGSDAAAQEIASAMGCTDMNALNSLCQKYLVAMPGIDEDVKMALANSVWYDDEFTLSTEFSTLMRRHYRVDALQRDFGNSAPLVAEINQWCADHTNNLINHIVDKIDPTLMAFFANAMYFKGAWSAPFEEEATTTAPFHGAQSTTNVKMMNQKINTYYHAGTNYQAAYLPFGENRFGVWFVMPDNGTDINGFMNSFSLSELEQIFQPLDLSLPRFKFTTDQIDLNQPLRTLGVNTIFDGDDLTMFTMPTRGGFLTAQKSTIEFNEKGAEASSISWGLMSGGMGPMPEPEWKELAFDRPFLFFITEQQTGACLMAGKIAQL